MKTRIKKFIRKVRRVLFGDIVHHNFVNSMLLAQIHVQRIRQLQKIESFREVEFKVYSQWGEDGIIQYLIHAIPIEHDIFVEFGIEDYTESNTRFLLMNDNWKGLVIDGNSDYINGVRHDEISWRYDLTAVCQFITKDNINAIIADAGIKGDIGLLSIDVDGNDYWVWEAINIISPRIVICEYNSVFGADHAVTIPYDVHFQRAKAHYSHLYFGASLPALCLLAEKKGYDFVGSNSAGTNAFFIRNDLPHKLKRLTAKEGYVISRYRESRDPHGNLTYISGEQRVHLIKDLQVWDIPSNKLIPLHVLLTGKSVS